jgi:hypothetical protein
MIKSAKHRRFQEQCCRHGLGTDAAVRLSDLGCPRSWRISFSAVWCCTVSQPFAPTEHARCTSPIRRSNGSWRSLESGGSMDRTVAKRTRIGLTLIRQERVIGHCPACGQTVQLFELNSNRFGQHKVRCCPRCQRDLIETVQDHLYHCSLSPDVFRRAARTYGRQCERS